MNRKNESTEGHNNCTDALNISDLVENLTLEFVQLIQNNQL